MGADQQLLKFKIPKMTPFRFPCVTVSPAGKKTAGLIDWLNKTLKGKGVSFGHTSCPLWLIFNRRDIGPC